MILVIIVFRNLLFFELDHILVNKVKNPWTADNTFRLMLCARHRGDQLKDCAMMARAGAKAAIAETMTQREA